MSGKMVRFRIYDGFTGLSTEEKYEHASRQIDLYYSKMRSGWDPFKDDSTVVYNDNLAYKSVSDIYQGKRSLNRCPSKLISDFLGDITPTVAPATLATYRSKLRVFSIWLNAQGHSENDIATINNQVIIEFFKFLINSRKLSGNSVQKYRRILRTFFAYVHKKRMILINPVFDLPTCNRIVDRAPRPIMRDDIVRFKKEAIKDPYLWLAIQLQFYCALRPGFELRLMKIKDIDFSSGTIRVTRERAKTRQERVVTVPRQLLDQLRYSYRLNEYNREYYVFGRLGTPGTVPIGRNNLRYRFNRIRKELGMPLEYKFYSWKHTGAVEADEAQIPMKDISRHLGHGSLKSTDAYFRNKKPGLSKAIRDNYPDL
jgi:integrase